MITVSLKDESFRGGYSSNNGILPVYSKYFKYDRDNIHPTVIYTEDHIIASTVDQYPNHNNIAWLVDTKAIRSDAYNILLQNIDKYNYILTHDLSIINQINVNKTKALFSIVGGCWIEETDRKIYNKTKNLSIIASWKNFTEGHKLRHSLIKNYKDLFNGVYGNGYCFIENKIQALKDYRFSVVIENNICDDYFTEKLMDCIVTGTIPIYYGTDNIKNYFNIDGFITIKNEFDFVNKKHLFTEEFYLSKLKIIKENFEIAKNYVNTEDWAYLKYKKIFF